MKYIILILLIFLSSCELIVIGNKPIDLKPIIIKRDNPVGAVLLFKSELENNNVLAASEFIANPNGHRLKATEKLELYDDLPRFVNQIPKGEITNILETLQEQNIINVKIEFDYITYLECSTKKIDSLYFILNYRIYKQYY